MPAAISRKNQAVLMRIISGKYGGRRINAKLPAGVRPTLDSARETMFNILNNLIDFDGIAVLDLFAGSGMLGFESLSRGAGVCYSIEKSRKTYAFIKKSAQELKIDPDSFQLVNADATKYIKKHAEEAKPKFDLVFMDPPYNLLICSKMLELLAHYQILEEGAILCIEHDKGEQLVLPEGFELINTKKFGATHVDFVEICK
jgi:16S rRNA (guanine966-N2)-methyltransferase